MLRLIATLSHLGEDKANTMAPANTARNEVEAGLTDKIRSALSPSVRGPRVVTSTGIQALDSLLDGGILPGVITEIVGPPCSGRSSVALSYISAITQFGSVCAWIDVDDSLDPESAAANGIDLEKLLWVRCGSAKRTPKQTAPEVTQSPPSLIPGTLSQPRHTGGGSPHPRSEGHDMPQAISSLLHAHGGLYDKQVRREKKKIGTPGMPNRPLSSGSLHREEQVNSDRLPPRRGDNLAIAPRCAEPQPRRIPSQPSSKRSAFPSDISKSGINAPQNPWQALDQGLRATDLLLQSGGFSTVILDLGNVQPEIAWRVPLATWFRFRAACERTRISLVLLTQHPCARSSAELVLRLQTGSMDAQSTKLMTSINYCATRERSRFHENNATVISIRKPAQSERPGQWQSEASWAQAK
jgi:recombination protein RecA